MNVLIVPTAKVVDKELNENFFNIPSVLINLENKTVIEYLYEQYKEKVDKIIMVSYKQSGMILDYISFKKLDDFIEVLVLDRLGDLGYSIKSALDYINNTYTNIDNLYINFGDTIINENIPAGENLILYSQVKESLRWTTFEYSDFKINEIYDKRLREIKENYNSFVGVFSFTDSIRLRKLLYKALEEKTTDDSFYKAIKKYNKFYNLNIVCTENWLDVGHLDMYYKSAKEVKSRYFNNIKIDKKRGILTKTSDNVDKLINEIKWYLKLPSIIQYLAPRIFDYSISNDAPYINMEYYSYNNLHNIYVYGNQHVDQWKVIFNSLEEVINEFKCFTINLNKTEVYENLKNMYVKKTIQRLSAMKNHENFKRYFDKSIFVNGKKFESITYYLNKIEDLLDKYNIYDIDQFQIIHGDFCLSNILYSLNSGTVRLIDPRGSFGNYDIYGDVRYDLAKLSHSIRGKYDFIIEDLFQLVIKGNNINYMIYCNENHREIEKLFLKRLAKYGNSAKSIQLIESLLFFSMIPLHEDYPNRQVMMLAIAIQLIDELI